MRRERGQPGPVRERHRWHLSRRAAALCTLVLAAAGATVYTLAGPSSAVLPTDAGPAATAPGPGRVTGDVSVHDPSLVIGPSGYLLYGTHDGIQVRTSPDRTAFTRVGPAFSAVPAWVKNYSSTGDLWAPDVSRHGGKYLMYYAASTFGTNTSAIGLATSITGAAGSWRDQGIVYRSNSQDTFNAIDPSLLVDARGGWRLTFGSYWSDIHLISLDPSTGKQSSTDRTNYSLAYRPSGPHAEEAPYILYRNGYYYLFTSFDQCCQGTASTYRIMVGRATRPTGPYTDRAGTALTSGGGTQLLATHGSVIGPGGQSVLADRDGDLLVYHYYDGNAAGRATLGLNLLGWDSENWPYVR